MGQREVTLVLREVTLSLSKVILSVREVSLSILGGRLLPQVDHFAPQGGCFWPWALGLIVTLGLIEVTLGLREVILGPQGSHFGP